MPNGTLTLPGQKPAEAPVKMVAMKLERNYRPAGAYEIVGYLKPEVKKKTAAGDWKVVEPEQFIAGEPAPPMFPGVGFENKIWANTTIKVPEDEARVMRKAGIASVELAD